MSERCRDQVPYWMINTVLWFLQQRRQLCGVEGSKGRERSLLISPWSLFFSPHFSPSPDIGYVVCSLSYICGFMYYMHSMYVCVQTDVPYLCRWGHHACHTLCHHTRRSPQTPTSPVESRCTVHSDRILEVNTHTHRQTNKQKFEKTPTEERILTVLHVRFWLTVLTWARLLAGQSNE